MKKINSKPLVSIIMNCHNGEKYLNESLNCIQSQTYKNWELIFFDNNSKDKSRIILKKYKDKRIKYHGSNKKLKLYDARNQAIKKSKGKYICFLDTDDLWTKNKIKYQVKFMEANKNYSMVYSNFYTLDQFKKKTYIQNKFRLPSGYITKKILKKYTVGILTVCIKKNIFNKNLFEKKYNIVGDFDFFVKISLQNKVGCIQKPLAYYRIHENNYSKKKIKNYIEELNQWITRNERIFKSINLNLVHQKIFLLKLKIKYYLYIFGRVVQW